MSIDLTLELTRPISLKPLLPKIAEVLADMLGVRPVPKLTLDMLENGERLVAESDELRDRSSPLFLISIAGEPETVGVLAGCASLCVEMGAARTNLEYALGAAVAIQLARELGVCIDDNWGFYSERAETSADGLFAVLRVPGPGSDLQEAAEQLTGRIDRVERGSG